MIEQIWTFLSHVLFIYLAHVLLVENVDWAKFLKPDSKHPRQAQLLVLFLAIALGYLVSHFFLDVVQMSRQLAGTVPF